MALRFRKLIKLAPGLRMNLSGSGVSWSLGPRGASVGIGRRGTYLNSGIPGTGLYSRQRLSGGPAPAPQAARPGTPQVEIAVFISDDGTLTFKDASGNPIAERLIEAAKKQQGDKIKALIQGKCDEINGQIEALGKIHEYTSPPVAHAFEPKPFAEPMPFAPAAKAPGFLCRFFKSCVAKIEEENRRTRERHEADVLAWEERKRKHEEDQRSEKEFVGKLNAGDAKAMEEWFETVLQDIAWPQETLVAFDMPAPGILAVDVDLPEIEDMPSKTATVPQRGFKLSVKEMGPTQVQKLYMRHVHAVGFRIAGEAFAVSPAVEAVVLSAYSQRPDRATGKVGDEYLYSVRIPRDKWRSIDFGNLANLDPIEALSRFDLRREMSKTGVFKPIEPFDGKP
ncbi:MAG: DUF4236 domain-containing protein [Zoogloeaceae bacterium]|nr:DUF4236 domain-containing protein [Zoogloeaceae bacterium]